jgi:hypothetical protein
LPSFSLFLSSGSVTSAHAHCAEERFNPNYLTPFIDHFNRLTVADIVTDPKKTSR